MENEGWSLLATAILRQAFIDHDYDFFKTEWCDTLIALAGFDMNGRELFRKVQGGVNNGERKRESKSCS